MSSSPGEAGNTVIIGIDFGTTFSGVAFTWSNKIEDIEVISSWESDLHSSSDEEKVPTALSFGKKNKVTWGYNIPYDAAQARWFKLLLVDDEDLPDDVRRSVKVKEARAYLKKHNKTAIEVIALFLRQLWNHSIQRVTEIVSRNLVNYSRFHIVITLPAIWPEYARGRMREAASLAGMLEDRIAGPTELSFISEPEAAALATLSDMKGRSDIKAGDSFVVVDCGGGTVDLISYEVVNIAPMVVKECVKGQGGLCGAVFVDEAFLEILKQKFSKTEWAKMKAETLHRLLHDEWEHGIKPTFDGREKTWNFNMPFECLDVAALKAGAGLPKIMLTAGDVRNAFDPVVSKISTMVDEQVAAVRAKKCVDPKYVIMAGGFGRCRYLFTTLKAHLGNTIEVLQSRGSGPWTSICRGAVIFGANTKGLPAFSIAVQERIARASYGIMTNCEWCPESHDPRDKYWSETWQEWQARDQMKWFIKVGDNTSNSEPVIFKSLELFDPEEATRTRCSQTICTSTSVPPPKRWDASVKELCEIRWDTRIDIGSLPTFTNRLGKVFHQLDYDVQMTCTAGSLDFAVYHDGKRQGSKHVQVDYEGKS